MFADLKGRALHAESLDIEFHMPGEQAAALVEIRRGWHRLPLKIGLDLAKDPRVAKRAARDHHRLAIHGVEHPPGGVPVAHVSVSDHRAIDRAPKLSDDAP